MDHSKRPIQSVAIIGAGGLGAAYGSLFHEMDRRIVSFVARGERYDRLKAQGVIVNDKAHLVPVVHAEDNETPPSDLVIVAVKYHHLNQAIRDMKNRISKHTLIMSVMNGIDSEERIGAAYGMDGVLYAVSVGIDALREENRIIYTTQGKLYFGEARNETLTDRVGRIQALFDQAGIVYEIPQDMMRIIWWKFMINVGINQASAVLKAPYGVFQTSQAARDLMEMAMREVISIAAAAGVHLSEADIANFYEILPKLSPQGKTSMLQDVEAGRKTEVEMLAGKMIGLGRQYGIPTPVNKNLFQLIREAELSAS